MAGYLAYVLRTSAEGGKHLSDFPEFRDVWDEIVLPLLLLGFSLAVALTPAILYSRYAGWDFSDPVAWVLCGWAVGVFPIVAMVTTVTRSIFPALNPVTYLLVVLYVGVLVLAGGALEFLRLLVDLYFLFLTAHLLGRAIHETGGKVDWSV